MQELSRTEKRYKAFLEEVKVIPLEKKYKTQYIRTKEAPKIDKDIISEVKYDRITGEFCYTKKAEDDYYDYGATIKKYLKENFSKEGQGIFLPTYDSVLSMY